MFNLLELTRFRYCPRCASQALQANDDKSFICESCGFIYYHGTIASVVAILVYKDQLVITRRGNEPYKGWLAFPGGFVDYGESLENALYREMKEELNIGINKPEYFCSYCDRYCYLDVEYQTSVAYFLVLLEDSNGLQAGDDVSEVMLKRSAEIDPASFAFDGDRVALELFLNRFREA
ncbi:MAG: NUDIX domain-containing protein [Calditrichales bacterium]|nr:MAG: NUDIX domain-containing protein [Calditrichales bacterium]